MTELLLESPPFAASLSPQDSPEAIAQEVAAINAIASIPTLLEVVCDITGMGFAAVARVTDQTWTACIVKDDINLGLKRGSQLDVETTLCIESKHAGAPIMIDHASRDPRFCNHPATKAFKIESYVAMPIVMPDGRYFGNLIAIHSTPSHVSDPRVVAMFRRFASLVALQLDSEIKQEQTRSALRDSRATNELREQFIAILGHDLRNPLQAVSAIGELLEKKSTDSGLKDMATRIRSHVKRMSSLIDDVLDFARGRLGAGIGINVDTIDTLASGLNSVVKEFREGQPHREIVANISVTRAVRCDLGRVQQVASNLIGNALSHGAPLSPVKVTVLNDEHDLVLEVWNAGVPIPADAIDKIFEPFWRPTSSGRREGLGLGLHICSQIVRAHGGNLSVTSTQDGGTNFRARLPLRAAPLAVCQA